MSQGTGNINDDQETKKKQVVDFSEVRAQKLEEKRRNTERIFFKQLLNVYTVAGDKTLRAIEFIEMSDEGCSFQVPYDTENPWPTDIKEIPLRIYFTQDTYLEVRVKILNSRPSIENNQRYVRFGCTVDTTLKSHGAYAQFVRFLKSYSEHCHKDNGDLSVFYI